LRTVLYAATTGSAGHVIKEEAEVLFDIAHATARAPNDPSFDDLFARAIGNYLMAISPHAPDLTESLHLEKWLDQTDTLEGFLSRMWSKAWPAMPERKDFRPLWEIYEDHLAHRDTADAALQCQSEEITEAEATWVMAHLTRDGELTSAERQLLQFLKIEAPSIAPSLRDLIDEVETTPAS